jgi:hypothetical protein
MKTDDLIAALSVGAGSAPRAVAARRLVPASMAGVLLAATAALAVIGPAPAAMLGSTALWAKLGYTAALALSAAWLTARLARPASPAALPWRLVIAVVSAMGVFGFAALVATPPGERLDYLLGYSSLQCPWNVLALSLPALAASLWAVRGLAPVRPRAAGMAAGLLAGSLGAFGYALACPEVSITFVATWYSLGIALTATLGALLGPWVLRW